MKYNALKCRYVEPPHQALCLPMESLHLLYPVCSTEFYERVRDSIKEQGLIHPLVVRKISVRNLRRIVEAQPGALLGPPEELLDNDNISVVVCGNNRLRAAQELGYTHIDVVVVHGTDEQNHLVREIRRGWK